MRDRPRIGRTLAFLFLMAAAAGGAFAQDDDSRPRITIAPLPVADARFWSLAWGVYASGAADWYTTRQFRAQGVEEANILLEDVVDDPAAFAVVKAGLGTVVNTVSYGLKRSGKRYWATPQIAWIVLNLAVSAHNHNQVRQERE